MLAEQNGDYKPTIIVKKISVMELSVKAAVMELITVRINVLQINGFMDVKTAALIACHQMVDIQKHTSIGKISI